MIGIEMELPKACENCPCSYWIQSGQYEGLLMCNVLEYTGQDLPKAAYLVDMGSRPEQCPMKELKFALVK